LRLRRFSCPNSTLSSRHSDQPFIYDLVRIRQGKGRKEREVPLNATARRALGVYLEFRGKTRADDYFFSNGRGKSLPTRTIQAVITELARRAKISRVKVSAHTLRHTFALNYLRQNPGKLVDLASLLGHESLDTTAIYTRPSKEELAADLERSRFNVY
jgi:site-specific recombinase XerD